MSQVRILSPRLTFPNDVSSPPESWTSDDVGERRSLGPWTAVAAFGLVFSILSRLVRPIGGAAVPSVTTPPTIWFTVRRFLRIG